VVVCPNCGVSVDENEERCPSCSVPLQIACPDCGTHAPFDEDVCPACGASLAQATEPT
jgi:RNA polymerase subunit RPABC4/transcription elongation factor Spt4